MTYTNLPTPPTVRDAGDHFTESGMRVPATEVRTREIVEQAELWVTYADERTRMARRTIVRKALASVAFSVQHGSQSLAIPSKLCGTSEHQRTLWALVREHVPARTELELDDTGIGLSVRYDDDVLGEVQGKHLGWIRPLVPFGLRVYMARVTGVPYQYTLGLNCVFGHVGLALGRLHDALGAAQALPSDRADADLASGDGAAPAAVLELSEGGRIVAPQPGGDGAAGGLRLVVPEGLVIRPEHDAVRPGADPADVVLFRRVDGAACASVEHRARHSPTGIDWGRRGSGPADLAYSVLAALADEATAERLYGLFEAEVVAGVPFAGGVLRAADVRGWIASQSS